MKTTSAGARTADLDIEMLGPPLREWVDLIGLSKTMLIVDLWGGLQLYIAKEPPEDSDLVKVIGLTDARKLGEDFGGVRLVIPKALRALHALRNARIRHEYSTKSIRQLCIAYDLTERRICQILAEDGGVDEQTDLFD